MNNNKYDEGTTFAIEYGLCKNMYNYGVIDTDEKKIPIE